MTKHFLFLVTLTRLVMCAEVMPLPSKTVSTSGKLTIDSSFSAAASGYSDARLQSAINRFVSRVSRQTGIPMRAGRTNATLVVECREGGSEYPALGEDESYRLDISPTGARLNAATVTGAIRGLETFAQSVGPGTDGFEAHSIHIEDQPRFPWRGLMLDAS